MIIGCDYSTKAIHFCSGQDGKYQTHAIREEVLKEEISRLEWFFESQTELSTDNILYIEKPFARGNIWTGVQMQRMATIIEVVATQWGVKVKWANTQAWRTAIFGKGKYTRAQAKKLAIAKALEVLGEEVDDNTADALCICLYGESLG